MRKIVWQLIEVQEYSSRGCAREWHRTCVIRGRDEQESDGKRRTL
jgi:hypothetical protein